MEDEADRKQDWRMGGALWMGRSGGWKEHCGGEERYGGEEHYGMLLPEQDQVNKLVLATKEKRKKKKGKRKKWERACWGTCGECRMGVGVGMMKIHYKHV